MDELIESHNEDELGDHQREQEQQYQEEEKRQDPERKQQEPQEDEQQEQKGQHEYGEKVMIPEWTDSEDESPQSQQSIHLPLMQMRMNSLKVCYDCNRCTRNNRSYLFLPL